MTDMENVLVDTSIWVSFFGGKDQKINGSLQELLKNDQVVICPPIYQEILQGIKFPKDFLEMKEKLDAIRKIHADPFEAAEGAAQIYSILRNKEVTIRKSYDCLIAWYAISSNSILFHSDKDFIPISKHFKLGTYPDT
jgi:predicted nucleic acid-binding protein